MPRAGRSHYVVLKDKDENLKTGLKLLEDEGGKLMYGWDLAAALAPDVPAEEVSYGQYRPDQEIVWGQNDWSGGGLAFYHDPRNPDRYAVANKVWALTRNELSLGPEPIPIPFSIPNGGAELAATTNWSASGMTLTAVTTAPFAGVYHFQMASTSTNDYMSHSMENDARWQGKGCSVTAKVRGSAAGGAIRVQIVETGGSSTPTTSGTAATLTTSYQSINANVVIQADTTGIEIRIECSADGGSDRTVYVDEVQAQATSTGTEDRNNADCRMVVMNGTLICVTETAVYKFNETSDYWSLQKNFGVAITGFEVFDNRLFVGLGESTAYQYSDASDATAWTAASGGGNKANYFIKALNANSNWAMAKTLNEDEVYLNTDPTTGSSWGSAIDIGKDDHLVTNVYNIDGTIGVGKEDGFYRYLQLDGNRFANVYPAAESSVDPNNFSRGLTYNGQFYTVLSEVGLIRYNGSYWQDLSHLIESPAFSEFGSRVRAFGTDGRLLYLLVEDLNAASITKQCWLLALREYGNGQWITHTLTSLSLSDANDMYAFRSSSANNQFLFINGASTTSEAMTYRLQLPNRTSTPRLATNKNMALSGTIITPYWDGNRPQVDKTITNVTLITENLSTNRKITVAYELDDDTSFTNINSTNSDFTSSPQATIVLNEGVVGRRIRFRLTFTTNDATNAPVLKTMQVGISWQPDRLTRWNIVAALENEMRNLQGVRNALTAKTVLSQLRTMETDANTLIFEDIDGQEHRVDLIDMSEGQFQVGGHNGTEVSYSRGVALTLMEKLPGVYGYSYWDEERWG
jgi:hypothetical protein